MSSKMTCVDIDSSAHHAENLSALLTLHQRGVLYHYLLMFNLAAQLILCCFVVTLLQ